VFLVFVQARCDAPAYFAPYHIRTGPGDGRQLALLQHPAVAIQSQDGGDIPTRVIDAAADQAPGGDLTQILTTDRRAPQECALDQSLRAVIGEFVPVPESELGLDFVRPLCGNSIGEVASHHELTPYPLIKPDASV